MIRHSRQKRRVTTRPSEIIDLIRDSLTFDFGYLHSNSVNGVGHMFVNWIRNNNNNIASDYDKAKSATEEKLAKVLRDLEITKKRQDSLPSGVLRLLS